MDLEIYRNPKDCEYNELDLKIAKDNLEKSYRLAKIFLEKFKGSREKPTQSERIFAEQIKFSFNETYKNYRTISPEKIPKEDLDWISEVWKTKKTIEEIIK